MSPTIKYTLGRIGLFVVVLAALWPLEIDIFIKLMIALLASAGFSYFLLRGWRDQMANQMSAAAERRKAEKERLRAALAGEDAASEGRKPPAGSSE
ncbi:DUF4229 domain-containing protein [Phytohabitans rumicis]|uniref:DUF4229 domain-containing protein n=1 Tax=Phytohabitans rumicis TaxID=1076125 RepID=A0A6V8L5U5_9ACTN|nr:DUF4229 domain-containing protein [Phytohabitans rumicis]GFJ90191.1 hypothetical protein Prum_038330 [Phytohabitans rumicis]